MHRKTGVILTITLASGLSAAGLNVGIVAAADSLPYMVENIRPGGRSSNPSDLTAIGTRLYFTASDGKHGREPWISDGTAAGTHLIKNISPGSYSSNARDYALVGNQVFFTAQDGNGRELWKTDGTEAGTVRVRDIRPGDKSSKPTELTALGSTLYFSANDGPHGQELWKSDGTEAGTALVSDIDPGRYGSTPTELTAYQGAIYFVAHFHAEGNVDGPCCASLHRSDGSSIGTEPVRDSNGDPILLPSNLARAGSLLYFEGLDASWEPRLWRTNGTPAGTKHVSPVFHVEQLTDVAGRLFFIASPEYEGDPAGLWKSDGTKAGTQLIKTVYNPSQLTAVGSDLFYTTLDPDGYQHVRVNNGVARDSDSWVAALWSSGHAWGNLTNIGGTLFMTVGFNNDLSHQSGWGLYWFDCTQYAGGCTEYSWLKSAVPYELRETWTVEDHDLTAVNGALFYAGEDYHQVDGVELWSFAP